MTQFRMTALSLVIALLAAPVVAAEATDAPVATGPADASSVAEQIDAYLKTSPVAALPDEPAPGVTPGAEARTVHGVVELGIGTHGYRSAYVQSVMPLGQTGSLSIAVGESRGPAAYGSPYGGYGGISGGMGRGTRQSVGIGLDFSADAPEARGCGPGHWKDDGPRRLDPASADDARRLPCGPGRGQVAPDRFLR